MNVRSVLHLLLSWHAATTLTTSSRLDGSRGFPGEESAPDSAAGTTEEEGTTDGGWRTVHRPERKLSTTRSCKGAKGKKGGCVEPAFCKNRTTFKGHIYVHMPKGISWPDAHAQVQTLPRCCGDKEAHLVSISSEEEADVVYDLAPRGLPWTGLYFNFLTNAFEWVDGSTPYPANYSAWAFDEEPPRPLRDPCGYLQITDWDLARCSDTSSGYVAEYDCE